MSLYGKDDGSNLTGSLAIDQGTTSVTGSGTAFTTELEVGDLVLIDTVPYRVATITSNTAMTFSESFVASDATGKTGVKRTTPRHLSPSESNEILGVTAAEAVAGGNDVVEITVTDAGSGYVDAADAGVSFSAGSAAATAVIATGQLSSVTVTAGGNDNSAVPTVTVSGPTASSFNAATKVVAGADTIELTSAQVAALSVGDPVTYGNGSNSDIPGLTNGTKYYVESKPSSTTIKLSATLVPLTVVDITNTGSGTHTLTGDTATATAVLGAGSSTGVVPGWVKRTVGTGGRVGRITYETLVASGSITGDQEDIKFPDA